MYEWEPWWGSNLGVEEGIGDADALGADASGEHGLRDKRELWEQIQSISPPEGVDYSKQAKLLPAS